MEKRDKKEILGLVKKHKMTAEKALQLLRGKNEEGTRVFSYTAEWKACESGSTEEKNIKNKIAFILDDPEIRKDLKEQSGAEEYRIFGEASEIDSPDKYATFVYINTNTSEKINEKNNILQVFNLTKEIIQRKDPVEMIYVYLNLTENVLPAYSAIAGFFRTLKNENPRINGRVVEIRKKEELLKQLWAEVRLHQTTESEVLYENGSRFVKQIVRCDLPAVEENIYHKNLSLIHI